MADLLTGAPLLAAVRQAVAERHDSGACHATPWVCSALDAILALCDRQVAGHAKQCELVRWTIRCDDHRCDCGYDAAEDALRAFLGAR